jgi:hypothetical protein
MAICIARRDVEPGGRLLEHFDIFEPNLKRKALLYSGQGDDHFALLAEFHHYSFDAFKDTGAYPHPRSNRNIGVRTQQKSARQPLPDLVEVRAAHQISTLVAQ